jgi:hypothetical protein
MALERVPVYALEQGSVLAWAAEQPAVVMPGALERHFLFQTIGTDSPNPGRCIGIVCPLEIVRMSAS